MATVWKNGVKTQLTNGAVGAFGTGIGFIGNDTYVAGIETLGNGAFNGVYWKNGNKNILSNNPANEVYTEGMTISGNDVYIVGHIDNAQGDKPVYWKNGVMVALATPPLSTLGSIYSIYVSNNDVYVLGSLSISAGGQAVYWKNGNLVSLTNGVNSAAAEDMVIVNNDVYIVGFERGRINLG